MLYINKHSRSSLRILLVFLKLIIIICLTQNLSGLLLLILKQNFKKYD